MVEKIQLTTFQRFFRTQTVGGSILLLFAIAALVLANSPLAEVTSSFGRYRLPSELLITRCRWRCISGSTTR